MAYCDRESQTDFDERCTADEISPLPLGHCLPAGLTSAPKVAASADQPSPPPPPPHDFALELHQLALKPRSTVHISISKYPQPSKPAKNTFHDCSVCNKKYLSLARLRKHEAREHGVAETSAAGESSDSVAADVDTDVKPVKLGKQYDCNTCYKTFPLRRDLIKHRRSVHEPEAAESDACDVTEATNGEFNCRFCGASFKHKAVFVKHVRRHTKAKPYLCDTCGAAYASQGALSTHLKEHSGHDLHPCGVCNKVFATRTRLLVHSRTHTGEKPFSCEYCGRSFTNISGLKPHLRLHTGEKPFKCQLCDYASTVKAGLRQHMVNHGPPTLYACHLCDKKFRFKAKHAAHVMMHGGERRHFCQLCSRGFFYANELKKHVTTVHTQERPFKCAYCEQTYKRKTHVTRHMLSAHKVDASGNTSAAHDAKQVPTTSDGDMVYDNSAAPAASCQQLVPPPHQQQSEVVLLTSPAYTPQLAPDHSALQTVVASPAKLVYTQPSLRQNLANSSHLDLVNATGAYLQPGVEHAQNLSQPKHDDGFTYLDSHKAAAAAKPVEGFACVEQPKPAADDSKLVETVEYDSTVSSDWYTAALASAVHYSQMPLQ